MTAAILTRSAESAEVNQFDVWRRLSPRRTLRVDVDGIHEYVSRYWSTFPTAPEVPYAVYLADRHGQFPLICFDLDTARGDVPHDHAVLLELLAEAGAQHPLSVFSGPAGPDGGHHVWLHLTDGGVPAVTMAALADALRPVLPSLDYGMLLNPVAGAARPPGAPHRHGGRATIDHFVHRDGDRAAMADFSAGDSPDVIDRLLAILNAASDSASRKAIEKDSNSAIDSAESPASASHRAARRRQAVDDKGARHLDRPRRDLSPTVWECAIEAPDHGDTSRSTRSVLVGAILAGWHRHEVADLAADTTLVGLEHLRSRPDSPGGRRIALTPDESAERLERQWDKAFTFVNQLPSADRVQAQAPSDGIDEACDAIAERMADERHRWATGDGAGYRGGPADKQVLRLLLALATEARTLEIGLDVRRAADRTGLGKSTVARALQRLADTTDPFRGEPWIELVQAGEGRMASIYRLLPAKTSTVDASGTQGTPTPRAAGKAAPKVPVPALLQHLAVLAHDVWTAHGGLGHECGETYIALVTKNDPRTTLAELSRLTTYTLATTRRHLRKLTRLGLAQVCKDFYGVTRIRIGTASLDDAAHAIGAAGAGVRRRERHDLDRAVWAWWCAELDWRTGPAAAKPAGVADDIEPRFAPDTPRWRFGRFPTTGGRADFTAARSTAEGAALR